jgi:hypothetical protein
MAKPKYSFSRKWFEAKWPSVASVTVTDWCIEHFGDPGNDAWSRWVSTLGYVHFRDESDYMLFLLKWSK